MMKRLVCCFFFLRNRLSLSLSSVLIQKMLAAVRLAQSRRIGLVVQSGRRGRIAAPAGGVSTTRIRELTSSTATKTGSASADTTTTTAAATSSAFQNQQQRGRAVAPVVFLSLLFGFTAGRLSVKDDNIDEKPFVLPNGLPRTCCDDHNHEPDEKSMAITKEQRTKLHNELKRIVGRKNVLDGMEETTETSPFLKGARLGDGRALFIVKPTKLKQIVEIVRESADANCTVLVQGQNTGLTGGSVPRRHSSSNDRPTVIISMKQLSGIFPIDNGERVVCMGGVGLATLSNYVSENFPTRESHSILGSTFLDPTTGAGIAFGSGGTQCRKGPAFTERALYLKIVPDKFGKQTVKVVNTLGIKGFDQQEGEFDADIDIKNHNGVIRKLDAYYTGIETGIEKSPIEGGKKQKSNLTKYGQSVAHDADYKNKLCRHDSKVSRYNADTSGNCDCNRSEGKVLILASVHDTFPKPTSKKTFWLSFDSLDTALEFRKHVCLDNPQDVPVSIEYMDRDSFDVIDRAGRLLGNVIKVLGTSSSLVKDMWGIKLWIEALNVRGASTIVDKLCYIINPIFPSILPTAIWNMGTDFDHHIAITVGEFGNDELHRFMKRMAKFQKENGPNKFRIHECTTNSEESSLTAFRFVAAPAFRTWCVGEGVQGFSVDYALPKNAGQAPPLVEDSMAGSSGGSDDHAIADVPLKRMRYSHFGCNVVHEDLAFGPNVDIESVKKRLKKIVEFKHGGKLPAEHGHGTEYAAPLTTQQRWKKMDPLNIFNPGIGGLSAKYRYRD